MKTVDKIVDEALTQISLNEAYTFWGALILRMRHLKADPATCPTACTDGSTNIWYNEEFMNKLIDDQKQTERGFILAHEVGHVVNEHCTHMPADCDGELWNIAGDHVINLELIASGMPEPTTVKCYADKRFSGMTTLEVYRILQQEEQKQPGKHKGQSGGIGQDIQSNKMTSQEKEELKDEIDKMLMGANMAAEMAGQPTFSQGQPGRGTPDMQRRLQDLLHPDIPWQHHLLNWCKRTVRKPGRTWSRLRRRMVPLDIIAPERRGKELDRISIATDGSGSIGHKEFTVFMGGVYDVLRVCKPRDIKLYQFDDGIRAIDIVKNVRQLLSLKFKGGGGTDVLEVFEDFNADPVSHGLIILTDGYLHQGHLPKVDRPVIWVVFDNDRFEPEQGSVIHFSMKDVLKGRK